MRRLRSTAVLVLLLLPAAASPQRSAQPEQLVTGIRVAGRLEDAAVRRFLIHLAEGDYAEVRVSFGGIARARLTAPDGTALAEVFSDHRGRVGHRISIVAEAPGGHLLTLDGDPAGGPSFSLTLVAHHPASPEDRLRARAAGILHRALRRIHRGNQDAFTEAASLANEAQQIWRSFGDPDRDDTVLRVLGHVAASLRDDARAVGYFRDAAGAARNAQDDESLAESLLGLAASQAASTGPEAAMQAYEDALVAWRELENPLGLGSTLDGLGIVHHLLGDSASAIRYLEEALPHRIQARDRIGEALTRHNRGMVAFYIGDAETATDAIRSALDANSRSGDPRATAHYTTNLARAYTALGELQRAFDTFTSALALWRKTGDRWGEALALGHMGEALLEIGESDRALVQFSAARTLYRALKDARLEGRMLTRIGLVYEGRRQFREALTMHRSALAKLEGGYDRPHEAEVLTAIGRTELSLGRTAPARRALESALRIRREMSDRRGEGRVLHQLGRAAAAVNATASAREYLEQALALGAGTGDREGQAAALIERARLDRREARLDAALDAVRRALELDDLTRARVLSPGLRATYSSARDERHNEHVALLYLLHRRHPTAGYDRQAFEAHERGRARALVDSLHEARVQVHDGVDPVLLDRIRLVSARINALEDRQFRAGNTGHAAQSALASELRARLDEYERLQAALRASNPRYAELIRPPAVRTADVQSALEPKTRLLVYHLSASSAFVWVIGSATFEMLTLPAPRQLDARIRRVVALLAESRSQTAQTALRLASSELARQLLGSAGPRLTGQRLIIAPDGALHYLPFGVLPASSVLSKGVRPGDLLTQHFDIAHVPSATSLRLLPVGRDVTASSMVVFADPVFEPTDPRVQVPGRDDVAADQAPGYPTMVSTQRVERTARTAGHPLPRLLYSRREAESIARLAGGSATVALDFDASLSRLQKLELQNTRILHFATHGFLHAEHPSLSGVVLSLVDEEGDEREGFLRLHDVYNLRLRSQLVVLSGCQTALGREIRGEGIASLARGFMYAGAENVIVSLWNVSDEATAVLMEAFYASLLRDGLSPSAALRAAQQRLQRSARWRAPYYWAGFVVQGTGR